jgi:hypothetical protein
MQLLKTLLPSSLSPALFLFAILTLLVACTSGSQMESDNMNGPAKYTKPDRGDSKVFMVAMDSARNCLKSPDQTIYRTCEIRVSYSLQSDLERESNIKVECEAKIEYKGRYGWMDDSESNLLKHTLDANSSENGNYTFQFKFNRNRKVTNVKDSAGCRIVSFYEY